MALVRPVLSSLPAYDARNTQIFSFSVAGGDRVVGNKLIVKRADTGMQVYVNEVSSTSYSNSVPANTFINGTNYLAIIQTRNETGEYSEESLPMSFWCYTTPKIEFTSFPENNTITNSTYNFTALYTQAESERLGSYEVFLYDQQDNIVKSISGDNKIYIYDNIAPPTYLNYTLSGLEDRANYKIEIRGLTIYNTVVSSGKISFYVEYDSSQFASAIKLQNNCKEGTVYIESAIKDLSGKSTNGNVTYVTDTNRISADLRNNGAIWDEQLNFNDNYTVYITARDFNNNSIICNLGNRTRLYYREFINENGEPKCRVELVNLFDVKADYSYRIYSNEIDIPLSTDYLNIHMICSTDLMDIHIYNIGG